MSKPLALSGIDVRRSGSGPAVVLLHCLGVDREMWGQVSPVDDAGDDLVTALGRRHTVLRYDFPGHGAAPLRAGPYSVDDLADDLVGMLDREGIDRASVAGISLGGLVAQSFAARYPHRVDKLVLIDTTPRYSPELKAMWHERAATARSAGVATLVEGLLSVWFSPSFIRSDPASVRYVRKALDRMDGEAYAMACDALAMADLKESAALIRAKTLVVCGTDDIQSFIEAATDLSQGIDQSQLAWLDGVRHASVLEAPRAFWAHLQAHLRDEP